ncbi:HAD family hydrolase [Kovacikia minuta CCNUW1]|uniref:HAD family hydrolase n=1 Tax=Kovacikia minuta TaxID=2931930 RepID=UPI001CCDC7BC|nr:HAD family hydrolase [Kovacikia minuta]UBF25019.1 HAD family hydrolase [Kovacikia minuta CCNUW1]
MSKLQALIFDVDGTLADTERDGHRVAFNRAFAEAELDWDWSVEQYQKLLAIAGGKERIKAYIDQYCPNFAPPRDFPNWVARLHQAKTHHYRQLVATGKIPLRPGVKRLIEEARNQGIKLAIATTSAPDNVTALLETNLAPDSPTWFEVIAAGDMVPNKKPAPDIYEYALQALNLRPEECLAIEDSYQGLKSATQAGIKTVITCNGYTQNDNFSGAALVLNHLGEPELPFQIIVGSSGTTTYFNVALAQSLLESEGRK